MRFKFLTSAANMKGIPFGDRPEIAFVGRSNAGKSSLINALANQKVALVSQKPGKTRLLNFFDVDGDFRAVDMPGYGFAHRSDKEQEQWRQLIEGYLAQREVLRSVILVMDIRRKWDEDEEILVDWLGREQIPLILVLNKADKVGKNEQRSRPKMLKEELQKSGLTDVKVIALSAVKKTGMDQFKKFLISAWKDEVEGD